MARVWLEATPVTTPPLPLPDPLVTARAKLDAYEARHGILGPRRREELLASYLAANQEPPPTIHPLGRGADPSRDHRTAANRQTLARALTQYFDGTLNRYTYGKLNKAVEHSDAATGAELADRVVSGMEIEHALARLWRDRSHLHVDIVQRFQERLSLRSMADRWHTSPKVIEKEIDEALDLMVKGIWRDR